MNNLAITAGVVACIAMCFASVSASPFKESAAGIDAKLQRNQFTQPSTAAANQVHSYTQIRQSILLYMLNACNVNIQCHNYHAQYYSFCYAGSWCGL